MRQTRIMVEFMMTTLGKKYLWNKGMTGEEYYSHFGGKEVFIRNILKGLSKRPTSL